MARGKKKPQGAATPPPMLPAQRSQPVSVPSGGAYGERKALEGQQQAGGNLPAVRPLPTPRRDRPAPAGPPGVFRPTERPGEPITSGVPVGAGAPSVPSMVPEDPDLLIKVHQQRLMEAGLVEAAARLNTYLRGN